MKKFSQLYISTEEELLVESKFGEFAKILGDKKAEIRNAWNDIKHLHKNVQLSFKGILAAANIKSKVFNDNEKKEIIVKLCDEHLKNEQKIEFIKQLIERGKKINNDLKTNSDKFVAYLVLFGKQLSKEVNNSKYEKYFDTRLSEIPRENIKAEKNNSDESTKTEEPSKPTDQEEPSKPTDQEEPSKPTDQEEPAKPVEEPEKIVTNVIEQPEIKKAAEEANIKIEKLKETIMFALEKTYDKKIEKDEYDEFEDLCHGLAEIICGTGEINNNDKINKDILSKYGIDNIEEFIEKFKTEK